MHCILSALSVLHAVYSQYVVCASRGVFVAERYILVVKRCIFIGVSRTFSVKRHIFIGVSRIFSVKRHIFLFGKNEMLLYEVGQDK